MNPVYVNNRGNDLKTRVSLGKIIRHIWNYVILTKVQQMFQSGWRRVADDVRDFSSETQKAVLYYWRDNGTVQVLTLHRGSWTARYW